MGLVVSPTHAFKVGPLGVLWHKSDLLRRCVSACFLGVFGPLTLFWLRAMQRHYVWTSEQKELYCLALLRSGEQQPHLIDECIPFLGTFQTVPSTVLVALTRSCILTDKLDCLSHYKCEKRALSNMIWDLLAQLRHRNTEDVDRITSNLWRVWAGVSDAYVNPEDVRAFKDIINLRRTFDLTSDPIHQVLIDTYSRERTSQPCFELCRHCAQYFFEKAQGDQLTLALESACRSSCISHELVDLCLNVNRPENALAILRKDSLAINRIQQACIEGNIDALKTLMISENGLDLMKVYCRFTRINGFVWKEGVLEALKDACIESCSHLDVRRNLQQVCDFALCSGQCSLLRPILESAGQDPEQDYQTLGLSRVFPKIVGNLDEEQLLFAQQVVEELEKLYDKLGSPKQFYTGLEVLKISFLIGRDCREMLDKIKTLFESPEEMSAKNWWIQSSHHFLDTATLNELTTTWGKTVSDAVREHPPNSIQDWSPYIIHGGESVLQRLILEKKISRVTAVGMVFICGIVSLFAAHTFIRGPKV